MTGSFRQDMVKPNVSAALTLREANHADCELLWKWVNEPAVRQASFIGGEIPLDQHRSWFLDKLNSASCAIYIAVDEDGRPVGVIRFETDPDRNARVSITVEAGHRGGGYASEIIRLGCQTVHRRQPIERFVADIKTDNVPSQRAFRRAGFEELTRFEKNGFAAIRMVMT